MKKMMKYSLLLAMGLGLASCFDQPESSTTSGGGSTTSYGGTTDTGGSTNDNGGTTDTGGTTTGTTGTSGYPPLTWNVSYAFNVKWYPRNQPEAEADNCNHPSYSTYSPSQCRAANAELLSMTTPTIDLASVQAMTDSRYKVRITVKPMPVITGTSNNSSLADKLHCYRRLYPGIPGTAYTSLTFTTYLQEVNCSTPGQNCSLGSIQSQSMTTRTVSVNSSTVIDYSSDYYRPNSNSSYALRIQNVKDQNGTMVRDFDCWEMKVELSTDYTQNF